MIQAHSHASRTLFRVNKVSPLLPQLRLLLLQGSGGGWRWGHLKLNLLAIFCIPEGPNAAAGVAAAAGVPGEELQLRIEAPCHENFLKEVK